jgi:hypothetical protein
MMAFIKRHKADLLLDDIQHKPVISNAVSDISVHKKCETATCFAFYFEYIIFCALIAGRSNT